MDMASRMNTAATVRNHAAMLHAPFDEASGWSQLLRGPSPPTGEGPTVAPQPSGDGGSHCPLAVVVGRRKIDDLSRRRPKPPNLDQRGSEDRQ